MSGNPLDKYRDTRTSAASCISGCGWIELHHQIVFVGDNGNTIPAAGARYQLQSSHGPLIQGVLDQNGRASHDGIGPGPVNIVYAPYIDNEKQIILKEIKRIMDEFITAEREEKARITGQTKNQSDLEKDWEALKAIGRAGYTVAVSAAEFFNTIVWGAAKEGFHLSQYLTPITAPAAFEKDVARYKNTKDALKKFTNEDLTILYTLMEYPEARQLFTQFASDYLDAQHGLEITEGTAEAVFSVILAFATASGGAAVAAGKGGEKLAELGSKLADPIQRLVVIIKQALAKKRVKGESNRLVESEVVIGDNRSLNMERDGGEKRSLNGAVEDAKFYVSPTPKELVQQAPKQKKRIAKINFKHIFDGEVKSIVSSTGEVVGKRAVGGHYLRSSNIRVTEIIEKDINGVMKARIQIRDPETGGWVDKRVPSDFFPEHWSKRQTQTEIEEAFYDSKAISKSKWEGVSPSGVRIQGYYKVPDGSSSTAWPVTGD